MSSFNYNSNSNSNFNSNLNNYNNVIPNDVSADVSAIVAHISSPTTPTAPTTAQRLALKHALTDLFMQHASAAYEAGDILFEAEIPLTAYQDYRKRFVQRPFCLIKPRSCDMVAAIVKIAVQYGISIVTQGGNTSLCGAATPTADWQIILSLVHLNAIRHFSPMAKVVVVEAGCTLAQVQQFAREHDCMYPLSLPSEAWCTIGGNLSTNAGGVAVLRYGNSRNLCLGLEVVLADGSIYHGLYQLPKNNMGYDLKHVFIGAEGTLGIITAASLQLHELPINNHVHLLTCSSIEGVMEIFHAIKNIAAGQLVSFEIMNHTSLTWVERYFIAHDYGDLPLGFAPQLEQPNAWYILIDVAEYALASVEPSVLKTQLAHRLHAKHVNTYKSNDKNNYENDYKDISRVELPFNYRWLTLHLNTVCNARTTSASASQSQSQSQSQSKSTISAKMINPIGEHIWHIRHSIPLAQTALGGNLKHDISVPIDAIPQLIKQTMQAVLDLDAAAEFVLFGHVGDGNLHFNVASAQQGNKEANIQVQAAITAVIHQYTLALGGSIAAEHGVGQLKSSLLPNILGATHYQLLEKIKKTLDPLGTFNPNIITSI